MAKNRVNQRGRVIFVLLAAALGVWSGVAAFPAYADTTDWTWVTAAALQPTRIGFTATLVKLPKGQEGPSPVLVTGGLEQLSQYSFQPLNLTQEYTVGKNIWTTSGLGLITARCWHTATSLDDGRVLVAGGATYVDNTKQSTINANCEILDWIHNKVLTIAPLNSPRQNHTATLVELPGGVKSVLVVGGEFWMDNAKKSHLDTSELYNPDTDSWETKPLFDARTGHTATLLEDGRVLVVGGFKNEYDPQTGTISPALRKCEIYDPKNNSWSPAEPLNQARGWHTATLLTKAPYKGMVLVAGGMSAGNGATMDSYEIYDPEKNTWTLKENKHLQVPRAKHRATELKDGHVLVVGGSDADSAQTSEIYQPDQDSWIFIQYGFNFPRWEKRDVFHNGSLSATLLDNKGDWVLVAGGGQEPCELFQKPGGFAPRKVIETGKWSWEPTAAIADSEFRLGAHTATTLSGGRVLVAGGYFEKQNPDYSWQRLMYKSTPIYSANQWQTNLSLAHERGLHTATLLKGGTDAGKVLVAGGQAGLLELVQTLSSCELWDPNGTGGWNPAQEDLPAPRVGHTATTWDEGAHAGKVLVAGGGKLIYLPVLQFDFLPAPTFLRNLAGSWADAGNLNRPRLFHTATVLTKGDDAGKILVVGGITTEPDEQGKPQPVGLTSCELYDPSNGKWSKAADLNVARGLHTATLLTEGDDAGKIVVAGGQTNYPSGEVLKSYEIYDPVKKTWTLSKKHLQLFRTGHTAILLTKGPYKGKVLVAGPGKTSEIYYPASDEWRLTRTGFNYSRNGHTATLLEDGRVFVFGGEIANGMGEIFQGPATSPAGFSKR